MSDKTDSSRPTGAEPTVPPRADALKLIALAAAGGVLGVALLKSVFRRSPPPSLPIREESNLPTEALPSEGLDVVMEATPLKADAPSPSAFPLPLKREEARSAPERDHVGLVENTAMGVECCPFSTGEIVRKGKALRARLTDPDLGVVLEVYSGYVPVTYKVLFFDGGENRRDIYWEEDLVKLNEMERSLFLAQYDDATREEILRHSRRD